MSSTKATTGNIGTIDAASLTGAALPAISGAALTNIPGVTNGAADPLISTNPSAVGAAWLNTTSGELFCCTDKTAGANIWTNVGAGYGQVAKPFGGLGAGTINGYCAGGYSGGTDGFQVRQDILKISLSSDGDSTAHGNLIQKAAGEKGTGMAAGHSSATHGYSSGGDYRLPAWATSAAIDRFAFSSNVTATDQGDLDNIKDYHGGHSTITHGYTTGGASNALPATNKMDRFPYASLSGATSIGTLAQIRQVQASCDSNTHGFICGGQRAGINFNNNIDKFAFSSSSTSTDCGDLVASKHTPKGSSTTTHGYVSGGNPVTDTIQKFHFNTDANATDVGNLTAAKTGGSALSAVTHTFITGGNGPITTIQKFAHASDGDSSNTGNLVGARQETANSQH